MNVQIPRKPIPFIGTIVIIKLRLQQLYIKHRFLLVQIQVCYIVYRIENRGGKTIVPAVAAGSSTGSSKIVAKFKKTKSGNVTKFLNHLGNLARIKHMLR